MRFIYSPLGMISDGVDENEYIVTTSGIPVTDFYLNLQYNQQARSNYYLRWISSMFTIPLSADYLQCVIVLHEIFRLSLPTIHVMT